VQLMAAAAQRQPWRGLNRWRYVGDPARPVGLRDRTSERFNCDDYAYLAPWENDCTIQTLHFLPPYYRGMQTGEVEREREREKRGEGPAKYKLRNVVTPCLPLALSAHSGTLHGLHPHVAHDGGDTECGNLRGLLGRLEHYFT
jgi:hypothetical protein